MAVIHPTVPAPVDHSVQSQHVNLASQVADPEIQPSNIVSAAYDEDPFDNSLNINLPESLVELQMDTLT